VLAGAAVDESPALVPGPGMLAPVEAVTPRFGADDGSC
jgi:hypothetical protein